MNRRQCKNMQEEVPDMSNLMVLADAACQEIESIALERRREWEKTNRSLTLPSLSNKDHKNARVIPLRPPNTNEIPKSKASKPSSSRMAAAKGLHDNQQQQQSLTINNNNNIAVERPSTTPSWVEQFARTRLHSSQLPVWIFGKPLTKSDTRRQHNRLFFPRSCLTDKLFPELAKEEREMLPDGVSVMGFDENGRSWNLDLIHWASVNQHLFKKQWIDLVLANNFQEGQTIHVWLCRYGGEELNQGNLCFLIGRLVAQPTFQ